MKRSLNTLRKDKEYTREQKLQKENEKLKRQLKQLRMQVARIPMEMYRNIHRQIEKQAAEELEDKKLKKSEKEKLIWKCHHCEEGYLNIIPIHRADGEFYFRRCSECTHKTKLKKLTPSVIGQED